MCRLLFCMWRRILRKLWCNTLFFFFQKNAGVSSFRDNYLEINAWLPQFFFVDSTSPCKDPPFQRGPNLAQKRLFLVGTVLKSESMIRPKEIGGLDLPIPSSENTTWKIRLSCVLTTVIKKPYSICWRVTFRAFWSNVYNMVESSINNVWKIQDLSYLLLLKEHPNQDNQNHHLTGAAQLLATVQGRAVVGSKIDYR